MLSKKILKIVGKGEKKISISKSMAKCKIKIDTNYTDIHNW